MLDALDLPFFQRVLVAALLASVASGVIGTYVVAKGITSISGGLAHASFGGIGLGFLLGFSPMLGAVGFGVASGIAIGLVHRRLRSSLDTLVSMVWALGMALGIVFVALAPGYAPDLTSYLFGSLLFVPWEYVYLVAALDVLILGAVLLLQKELQAVTFDEEFTQVTGVPVGPLFVGLLALAALAIVTLIRVVGVILAIALLTAPAAVGRQWASSLQGGMIWAVALCAACATLGLFLSYWLSDWFGWAIPPGPLIILLSTCLYAGSAVARRLHGRAAAGAG